MKNARDDIEAAKKLPDFKPYEPSSPNMPEFNILAICGMGVKKAESECRFNQEYWRTVAEAFGHTHRPPLDKVAAYRLDTMAR